MTLIVFVLFTILAIAAYRWLSNHLRIRKMLSTIPGPKQYPLFGIAPRLMNISHEDRLNWTTDTCYQFKNGMVLFWIGTEPLVIIRKPYQLEKILTSTTLIKKGSIYNILRPWLGEGLVTSTGETWFNHRRLITPAFHFAVLEEYATVMRNNIKSLNELIAAEVKKKGNNPIDIFDIVTKYTLDTICETAMGVSVNALFQPNNEYCQALHSFFRLSSDRFIRFWLRPDFIYLRTQSGKQYSKAIKIMHEFTESVIIKRQKERAAQKTMNAEEIKEDGDEKRKPKAFLDLLLDANENAENSLSLKELREEVDTFMFAGQDTTAIAICNALFAVGNAPDVQAKIHEELKEVFGDSTDVATTKQLTQLKYLERVIKETLRLYPSAPVVSRILEHDYVLDGHSIPKNTILSMHIYQAHRDPELWHDADKFDPDRFLPENSKGRHPYAYIPFSAGPRNCIGQKFAFLELKTVLTAIFRKWHVSSVLKPAERKMAVNVTLRPASGKIEMYFKPLEEQ